MIAKINAASANEGQFSRGLAALTAASAGNTVPSFALERSAIVAGSQLVSPNAGTVALSGGAIAGIVIASVAFVGLVSLIVYLSYKRSSVKSATPDQSSTSVEGSLEEQSVAESS